jgi:hypothetical protein
MTNKFLFTLRAPFIAAVLSVVFALPAQAITYDLVATPNPGDASWVSGFTIHFDDANADTRLDIGEIISFSGLTVYPNFTPDIAYFYNQVISIPVVYNIDATQQLSNHGYTGSSCFTPIGIEPWTFANCAGTAENYPTYNFSQVVWDYNITAVPIPAAVWLFGSGLLGMIGIARGKKAA